MRLVTTQNTDIVSGVADIPPNLRKLVPTSSEAASIKITGPTTIRKSIQPLQICFDIRSQVQPHGAGQLVRCCAVVRHVGRGGRLQRDAAARARQ